ncbi:MAG TPA: FAD-dependent oxidoreductase [Longimicrobiales bacterium]|nr:FAD-dependent oxidoreductase [Longimicrobiales bacterium]
MQNVMMDARTEAGGCWPGPRPVRDDLLEWIGEGPLAAAKAEGNGAVETLLSALRRREVTAPVIYVGTGTCGLGAGAGKTLAAVQAYVARARDTAQAGAPAPEFQVVEVGCIGLCSEEPILDVQLPGRPRITFGGVSAAKVDSLLDAALSGDVSRLPGEMVLGQFRGEIEDPEAWPGVRWLDEHPFMARQRRVVLATSGLLDPGSIDEYIAWGGYSSLAKALRTMTPEEICDLVEASGLRGRGGGGFPTGKKWKFALKTAADQKYLICNADEGDPGAFMNRAVGESDPHRLIEGILIASYAIGATKAYIYIRAEYPVAVERLRQAIAQARRYGLVGQDILGSGNDVEIAIKMGAGAFVCGEETALIHSLEGRRGMPRPRPPFPAVKGLFGKPTIINNVETLANLPLILDKGADWFASMGTGSSKGTKVFGLSGMVRRTGLLEVPMGTTLRQVVVDLGGGIANGKRCKAVQIGGPGGGCIPEAHLDIPTDYEALKDFGTTMGLGGLVVLDESTCMVDFARSFMQFIQSESCGKCIPCREGTKQMLRILEALCRSRKGEKDLDPLLRMRGIMTLEKLGETIKATSLCGLGQTAPNPVLSTLKWFREEYEAHVYERRCPAGSCKELVGVPCQTGCPVGTEAWRYVALLGRGEYEEAYKTIREANPFPSACARVCHHPCEAVCRAGATGGDPIAIRTLKRFVVDHVDPGVYKPVPLEAGPDAARVAVIGAGPAGLSAAHYLSLQGHKVTIFEKEHEPGGMLTGAIPAYRLPREVLKKEIDSLLNENIEVRYGVRLGTDVTVDGLLADGFRAVYVATGSHKSKGLGLEGADAEGVLPGIRFLNAHNLHGEQLARGRVGIIGGGNSAMDAARVAFRQEGVTDVTIFYRRTRAEMPAYAEEIEAGLEEGINIVELVAPTALHVEDARLKGVRLQRNRLGERDASGRQSPVPIPGSDFDAWVDTLIVAISEEPEGEGLQGLKSTRWGTLQVNPESYITDRAGVFAGGDVVNGPSTVIAAVAAGKGAAAMIDRYIRGKALKVLPKSVLPTTYVPPLEADLEREDEADGPGRVHAPLLPVANRRKCFAEVDLCISEQAALLESRRCLRCDLDFTQPD